MRIRSFAVPCLLLAACPVFLRAQFQEPSKQDLQMTDDPKSPGAAAVYLDVAEVTDDPLHFHSFYARVKVLQEKGKELATITIPYQHGNFKVTDVKGRTIHADRTVIPLNVKPEDLLSSREGGNQFGRMVFTLPSVEVGSIFEYRYQLRYDDNHYSTPSWDLQRKYFVHKAHYAFTPFGAFLKGTAANAGGKFLVDGHGNTVNSLIWWPLLPVGAEVKTDSLGKFSLDVTDIPPIPNEDWMPPTKSVLYHVTFYYKSAFSSGDFWQMEARRWAKDVDHFAEPTKPIRNAVAEFTAPSDSDIEKARKLYKTVQSFENTDYTRKKGTVELKAMGLHVAKRAEDTLAQKSGSSEDIALLYLALLRAAGLTAWDMKVVNRSVGIFSPGYLNFDQLDDDIIVLDVADKEILLDPGEKMCPFRMISWRHAGAGGVRQSAKGPVATVSSMLPFAMNETVRTGTVDIDEHGVMNGALQFSMKGQEAIYWRQQTIVEDEDEVKKHFDRMLHDVMPEGVEAHIDHFLGLDDPDLNLIAVINAKGTVGSATSKRLLLPGFFFEARGHRPFVDQPHRQSAVDMHYGERVIDQIVYRFPSSLKVEGAPQDTKVPFTTEAALDTKVVVAPGQITVARSLSRGFTFLKPEQYQDLRAFYQKVDANDQQQVVLAFNTEPKGN